MSVAQAVVASAAMSTPESKTLKHVVESMPIRGLSVEVIEGPDAGKRASAKEDALGIGTAQDNDLVLTDPTVSRYHLELTPEADRLRLTDYDSTNGVVVG